MYDRRVNGKILSFGHSGILFQWSFVLYDRNTGSLWVQANGTAEHGPLKGQKLRLIPSTVTTWKKWKTAYPDTLVLPGDRSGRIYGKFQGIGGNWREIGLVVIVKFKGKLYPYPDLAFEPVVNDEFQGTEFVVVYDREEGTATAWNRKFKGTTLVFDPEPAPGPKSLFLIRDRQTSTLWNWLTGKAVAGPLEGGQLKKMQSNPMLNIRFDGFFPKGQIFSSAARPPDP